MATGPVLHEPVHESAAVEDQLSTVAVLYVRLFDLEVNETVGTGGGGATVMVIDFFVSCPAAL